MTTANYLVLLAAGLVAGGINSVASGGSFFTYPALLTVGLNPLQAATTTLVALMPGNLFAIPEYWPEVRRNRSRYRGLLATVFVGAVIGMVLLFVTGADSFAVLAPFLVLMATGLFAVSPRVRQWAETEAPSLTDGRVGTAIIVVLSIYLTYFGSGVGNLFLAMLAVRGFGDFLSANAAKNVVMTVGTVMAAVGYGVAGWVSWQAVVPVAVGSAVGGRVGSRVARRVPVPWLRSFVIAFGVFVAVWLLAT